MKQYGRKIKTLWNQQISEGFWSEWWGSNPRASRSQTARSINWTTPGNQKIVYQKKQKKSFHCGQNCGKNKAFHHFDSIRRAEKHCAARVSGIWEKPLEHHTTMSQTKCLTDRLHPDIQFWVIIPRSGRKSKFFLSVVIYVVKAVFGPVLLPGKIPQMPVLQGVPGFGCFHHG